MKKVIINSIIIFAISALIHSVYKILPNTITAVFFPVNESIWEHNKMIMLAFFIFTLIQKYFFNKKNTLFNGVLTASFCAILVMLIFTPIFYFILKTNDNVFVTLIVYFICVFISQLFNKWLYKNNIGDNKENIGLFIWIIIFILNGILTFYPIKTGIFYDYNSLTYGIK